MKIPSFFNKCFARSAQITSEQKRRSQLLPYVLNAQKSIGELGVVFPSNQVSKKLKEFGEKLNKLLEKIYTGQCPAEDIESLREEFNQFTDTEDFKIMQVQADSILNDEIEAAMVVGGILMITVASTIALGLIAAPLSSIAVGIALSLSFLGIVLLLADKAFISNRFENNEQKSDVENLFNELKKASISESGTDCQHEDTRLPTNLSIA
jgi:hypothetical protein